MSLAATDKFKAEQYLSNGGALEHFISINQRFFLKDLIQGDEGDHFVQLVLALKKRIDEMPKSYETKGQGTAAKVYLHYFRGSIRAWITEKDVGDPDDEVPGSQNQAFGMVSLTGKKDDADLGFISIAELIENDAEIDLYWDIKSLKDI